MDVLYVLRNVLLALAITVLAYTVPVHAALSATATGYTVEVHTCAKADSGTDSTIDMILDIRDSNWHPQTLVFRQNICRLNGSTSIYNDHEGTGGIATFSPPPTRCTPTISKSCISSVTAEATNPGGAGTDIMSLISKTANRSGPELGNKSPRGSMEAQPSTHSRTVIAAGQFRQTCT